MILRVKGIKRVKAKGRLYHYHRASGRRIRAPFGSPDFIAEVRALDGTAAETGADTLGALLAAYRASEKFASLADRTRADYAAALDRVRAIGDMPLAQITPGFLTRLKDRLKCGARAKAYAIQVLSAAFAWGIARDWMAVNPARGVEIAKKTGDGNRPWTPKELAAVIAAARPNIRLAVMLGAFAGVRQGDVLRMEWRAWDGRRLNFTQRKTGRAVTVLAHRALRAELERAKGDAKGAIIVAAQGGKAVHGGRVSGEFF